MSRNPYPVRSYHHASKRSATTSFCLAVLLLLVVVLACKHSSHLDSPVNPGSSNSEPTVNAPPATSVMHSNLPNGFIAYTPSSGRGEVIIGGMTGNAASAAMWAALNSLAGYFDGKPRVLGAIVSANDDEVQSLIEASRAGQPVRGIAYAQATGSQCVVAVIDDQADDFSQSSGDLVRLAQQSFPKSSDTPVALHRTTLSDGTTLDLPDGWNTSTTNGAVSSKGPQGEVDLGFSAQVHTPEEAAQYPVRPPLVAAYGDPGRAFQELSAQMHMVDSPENMQIIERSPVPWWTSGVGETLHFQAQIQSVQREGLGQVLMSSTGFGQWMYYFSGVLTEQSNFKQNLPVLMRIWQSWKTDDSVFQERLRQAAESMQSCARIIREANAFRQDAMERSSIAWDHIVRGTWPIEDQQTHTRAVAQQDVAAAVRSLNESEGYERWRVVPYEELNR